MKITVGHLYPDYLNIYADRGNIAVLAERARARGHELEVVAIGLGEAVPVDRVDLFYVGGGQDREQALVAADLVAKGEVLGEAVDAGVAFLAVCGGYQLLGRFYRDRAGAELPGIGLLPLHTVAGERRLIGDVLLDCEWAGKTLAGFENHSGRTQLDEGAEPLGRVLSGFGNDGSSGYEGCRAGRVYGTYLHGPLLPRNPWFADRLLADALAHRTGEAIELEPLADELEAEAHALAPSPAPQRGGRHQRPKHEWQPHGTPHPVPLAGTTTGRRSRATTSPSWCRP
jgi:CobQ-like glutamine amidotransferase family enzyme